MQPRMDARYLYERSLAVAAETILRDGTCAPCLRPARFTACTTGGETLADGRLVPNWREELTCDCEDRLSNRNRAMLHFLAAAARLRTWSRVLLFGPSGPADRRIAAMAASITRVSRLGRAAATGAEYRLAADNATFHLAVSSDYLHRVPPLEPALGELRRVLVPGGQLVITVPFRALAARTVTRLEGLSRVAGPLPTEADGEVHELGWDCLDRLRAAGFSDACAHMYLVERTRLSRTLQYDSLGRRLAAAGQGHDQCIEGDPRAGTAAARPGRRRHRPQPVLRRPRRGGAERNDRPLCLCFHRAVRGCQRAVPGPRSGRRGAPALRPRHARRGTAGASCRCLWPHHARFLRRHCVAIEDHFLRRRPCRVRPGFVLGAGGGAGGGVPRPAGTAARPLRRCPPCLRDRTPRPAPRRRQAGPVCGGVRRRQFHRIPPQ